MKLTNEFVIRAPVEQVWPVLLDIERVAPCLPGASITNYENDEYHGVIEVRLGPISARYSGIVAIESADEVARQVVMRARGKEVRGQGTATAMITSAITETDDGAQIVVETDLQISGPAAQFGRGVMQSVSAKLMSEFANRLARELDGGPEAEDSATSAPDGRLRTTAAMEDQAASEPASEPAGVRKPPGPLGSLREEATPRALAIVIVLVAGALALLVSRRRRVQLQRDAGQHADG
jgi:uncharacterized protein